MHAQHVVARSIIIFRVPDDKLSWKLCAPVQVLERVRQKAAVYGQDYQEGTATAEPVAEHDSQSYKVAPETVASLYERWVMPLTKEVEVAYLLRRLEAEPG